MKLLDLKLIHHLKLNCEGCEYHILSDPQVIQMKEHGRLGSISGELHHFDLFDDIVAEMVEPTKNIMCNESRVHDSSGLCGRQPRKRAGRTTDGGEKIGTIFEGSFRSFMKFLGTKIKIYQQTQAEVTAGTFRLGPPRKLLWEHVGDFEHATHLQVTQLFIEIFAAARCGRHLAAYPDVSGS